MDKYNKFKGKMVSLYHFVKPYGIFGIILFVNIEIFRWFGLKWGLLGLLLFILIIVGIRYKSMWKYYMYTLREMETKMFGKSLDKKNWEKGELKQYKIKFGWKEKKEDKEK